MQTTLLKIVAISICLSVNVSAFAQSKSDRLYKERSEAVNKEIFETPNPLFSLKEVPEKYKDESAVILGKSIEYTMDKKSNRLFVFGGSNNGYRLAFYTTIREKVKINDQSALENYSSLEYNKKMDKTRRGLTSKSLNQSQTFIGVKIYKPNGKVVTLNTDEEILTTDSKKIQDGKLAISDLQVGDILDYYIRVEELIDVDNKIKGPYLFYMAAEYPILIQKNKFEIDKKAGIAYKAANGAPEFKQSRNENDDFVFELIKDNIPKVTEAMWSKPLRQIPYIELKYKSIGGTEAPYISGVVTKSVKQEDYLKELQSILNIARNAVYIPDIVTISREIREVLKLKYGTKIKDVVNKDSLAQTIFHIWQYKYGYNYYPKGTTITATPSINDYYPYNFYGLITLHLLFQEFDIENELVVTTSLNSVKLENIVDYADFELFLKTKSPKPMYFFMDNRFNTTNNIPIRFQGQDAMALFSEKVKKRTEYDTYKINIPKSTPEDNVTKETIEVSFDAANLNNAMLDRTCTLTGHFKSAEQIRLCLPEETDKLEANLLGIEDYITSLQSNKKTKKLADEFRTAFDDARKNWKSNFTEEITEQFGVEPKEVKAFDIKNYGIRNTGNAFIYNTQFVVDAWMKKAGNNYIFEAGKLIGTFTKIEEKERKRTIDVYMTCARSFDYEVNVKVPAGYIAKGLEALNKNISNEAASFVSSATLNGNVITIKAKRVYKNAFEPVANWPKLLEVMDANFDFTTQKILFEKSK
ncbi:MAG: hypothetical protein ACOVNY_13775 [Chitinophagaceae bacterium]